MLSRFLSTSILTLTFFLFSACNTSPDTKKVLFIGDSLVAGWDIESDFSYLNTINRGIYGAKINDINTDALQSESQKSTVVMLIGTNDISSYQNSALPIDFYSNCISTYKQKIQNLHASNVIVMSVLPRRDTGAAILNRQITELNRQLSEMTKTLPNCIFLDVYSFLTDKAGLLDTNYSVDGVHINIYGYQLLSAKLSAVL